MKILVVGNINSGKSYFVERISEHFPNYNVLKIDDFRRTFCDGSFEREVEVWQIFAKAVKSEKNAIVEITGVGKPSEALAKLNEDDVLIVKILTRKSVCLERLKHKDFSSLKYPKGQQKIEDTIELIDEKLNLGEVERLFFGKVKAVLTFDFEIEKIENVIEKIKKII